MSGSTCSSVSVIVRLLQELPTISNLDEDNVQVSTANFDLFVVSFNILHDLPHRLALILSLWSLYGILDTSYE